MEARGVIADVEAEWAGWEGGQGGTRQGCGKYMLVVLIPAVFTFPAQLLCAPRSCSLCHLLCHCWLSLVVCPRQVLDVGNTRVITSLLAQSVALDWYTRCVGGVGVFWWKGVLLGKGAGHSRADSASRCA